jgi:hypothetical protein
MQGATDVAAQIDGNAWDCYSGLDVSQVTDMCIWEMQFNRIIFRSHVEANYLFQWKAVMPFTDFKDTDEIPELFIKASQGVPPPYNVLDTVLNNLTAAKNDPRAPVKADKEDTGEEV